ncbi:MULTISPECIES: N-acetylglucosamine-6-phosphate deacetylase [Gardnerella]|uniref:N-acetylglucosamine-6-phosphate deacetylase n=1 Tax=Gardnerella greenwoodii 00703Dmash TaxID=698960 RepID=I4MAW1_9BIFI|nr:N-acetylglucosamine-6-phosphate deacetylase [Gardnerella greenwoodii]EIK86351.1 N-acetylglucosamine-6-phosphate deacetylase [Gardnerella greenwoodii 00703Dmash]
MSKNAYLDAVNKIDDSLKSNEGRSFVVRNVSVVDARGIVPNAWILVKDGVILETGILDEDLALAINACGLRASDLNVVDGGGYFAAPGYIDLHAHGAWEHSFDDGAEGIAIARAYHMLHGTTRQVLSLITNPLDVMQENLRTVKRVMQTRPDVLGSHLEGPFLALSRKGAHDPNCLVDPTPERVEALLEAADGTLRQITLAPERAHGMEAIKRFVKAGVIPAVGHCDADYNTARAAFNAGSTLMTHMFNAMNGIHHRKPGPIPAALEDPRVTIELINDGFHVENPVLRMAFKAAAGRIAFVTDAMAATGCADGSYKLGALDVQVTDGHARLVSNGAIAGSTLTLDVAIKRAVKELGIGLPAAIAAATLVPARALGVDKQNGITNAPLGLVEKGYAADLLLLNSGTLAVEHVWLEGHKIS